MATLAEALRGYQPPTTSALADPIVEHFRTLPQQLATNQQAMDNTMASMYKTDMATGQPNPNYRPEAMNEFTQMMPMVGALTAWHGTPHKILGKFDISKVGTGEGAQAYGHGMYFAEAKPVAQEYATDRSYVGKVMAGTPDKTPWDAQRIAQDTLNVHGDNAIEQLQKTLKANSYLKNPQQVKSNKQIEDAIDILKTNQLQPTGNLYKVDIPDADIPMMLDWDKSLTKQTPEVQAILKDKFPSAFDDPRQSTGQGLYKELVKGMAKVGAKDPEKFMSEILNEYGIKGIRYLDEGSRKTGGTSNFVVFDPSTVKILEENGKPTRKELIQQQIDKIE